MTLILASASPRRRELLAGLGLRFDSGLLGHGDGNDLPFAFGVPAKVDMAVDGSSRLYVASWAGGQFRYAGDNVGYIARLVHEKATPAVVGDLERATDIARPSYPSVTALSSGRHGGGPTSDAG